MLTDALQDTIKDTATLIPFLFITYLVMEWLEGRTEGQSVAAVSRMGRFGSVVGAGIGLIPQCGFSAAAAGLYSGGVISLGTMLAVFLSTSDEMLPIFLSSAVGLSAIIKLLAFKFVIAALSGIVVDLGIKLLRHESGGHKHIHDLCEQDNCGCEDEGGIVKSAAVHTAKVVLFIFIVSLAISLIVLYAGRDAVVGILSEAPILGTLLMGLVGLIPNCAASVIVAELYLEGMLSAGQMMSGLLVGAGVGILVLIKNNRHRTENMRIIAFLYAIGVVWGLLIDAVGISF
ncbi:MAG: arsenic efflux protein [Mogibacterium sp.]|nr:arsenic efflux protein [Mogibacterium sp.]